MDSYITCAICNKKMQVVTWKHLRHHGMTLSDYKQQYPSVPIKSELAIQKKRASASKANYCRRGVKRSQETKRRISETKKAKKQVAWNKGIPKTNYEKQQQSTKMKHLYKTGKLIHWNTGQHHSLETKNKISQTALQQQRIYSNHSKQKRKNTLKEMERAGWVHHNTKKFLEHLSPSAQTKLSNKEWLYQQHVINKRTIASLCVELGLHWKNSQKTIKNKLLEYQIPIHYWHQSSSNQQRDVERFLMENNIDIEVKNRKLIQPYELDIIIPSQKIAIEYCGLYWHSNAYKKSNYHKMKYEKCLRIGWRLITIFEDEWLNRNDIVKNKLLHILNASSQQKIPARKTTVVLLNKKDRQLFLDQHHIQGDGSGSVCYGLKYDNQIVSVAVFKQNQNNWLLNRFASSCSIQGGFSKILNYFKRNNNVNQIVTFADLRWDTGNLYTKNGFILDQVLPPDYSYIIDNYRIHKFNYRHKYLPNLLTSYDPTLSETQNCNNNGILRIYDCGKARFVLNC